MFRGPARNVKLAAAIIWYAGGIVLALKGWQLLSEADAMRPEKYWPLLAVIIGLMVGFMKAKLLFAKACQNNLLRIESIEHPKVWQCFRPQFFLFLFVMIILGAILSRLAQNNYPFLIVVALLDFSIAAALFSSSYIFWSHKLSGTK